MDEGKRELAISILVQLSAVAVPVALAGAYCVFGSDRPDAQFAALIVAACAAIPTWLFLHKLEWLAPFQLGVYAACALAAGSIAWDYLALWHSFLPENPLRAALYLPALLADHSQWLKRNYGEGARLVPYAAGGLAILSGLFAGDSIVGLARKANARATQRERAKTNLYGAARFMPRENMRKLSKTAGGMILGAEDKSKRSRLVSYPLEGAALTLAPPRTGKTAVVALNLLRPGDFGFRGSTIIVDPRGELWCITARRRVDLGRRVLLADPFGVVANLKSAWPELADLPAESVRYNPLDFIRDGAECVGDIDILMDALLTPPSAGASDNSKHFYASARGIITGFIAWVRFSGGGVERTLSRVRSLLLADQEKLSSLSEEMRKHWDLAHGLAREAAERMGRVGAQEAGSNFATIANQLDWLRYPAISEQTAASDYDAADIADGNTDIYVVVPSNLVEQVRAWIRLWIAIPNAVAIRSLAAERSELLIVIDEMPRLGYLKPVMDAYTTAAGAGVHFWGIAQTLSALEEAYGQKSAETLVDNSEVIQILGFPATAARDAERFSAALGTATFRSKSLSRSGARDSTSESLVRERLVSAHDFMSMSADTQFVVGSPRGISHDAIRLSHARYWERADLRELAGANPYVLRKSAT